MRARTDRKTYAAWLLAANLTLMAGCSKDSEPSDADDDDDESRQEEENAALPDDEDDGQDADGSGRMDAGRDAGRPGRDASAPGTDGSAPDDEPTDAGARVDAGARADAAVSGMDAGNGDGGATPDTGPGKPVTVEAYEARGPYEVTRLLNQGVGTIQGDSALLPIGNDNDPSAFTVYLPEDSADGERFPLLTFGNGTACSPTFYDALIEHVVSHGFVVVAANTSTTGPGTQMLEAVEWAIAQAADSSSPLSGMIDEEHIGAFGHSQGGSGTCNAGLDPRIDAMAPLSGVPINEDTAARVIPNIKIPTFFVNTADEAASATRIEDVYNEVTAPAVYGVTVTGNHDEYADIADDPGIPGLTSNDAENSRAGITAWFEWHLKGKEEVRALFVGADCGFCAGSTWMTMKSKGF